MFIVHHHFRGRPGRGRESCGRWQGRHVNLQESFHYSKQEDPDPFHPRRTIRLTMDHIKDKSKSADDSPGDLELARSLLAKAKSLQLRVMYFSHQRDQLCIELMEFIGKGRSEPRKATVQGKITSILEKIRRMSDYFELKPNIAGVGLSLNRVLRPKTNEDDPRGGE